MPANTLQQMEAAGRKVGDDAWISGAAACFEITTITGIRTYCGCLEYTSEHGMIVVRNEKKK